MSKIILFSKGDPAGRNIAGILRDELGSFPMEYNGEILYMDDADVAGMAGDIFGIAKKDIDICIVASRHRSVSGKPTLTAHPTGNFGKAGAGGRDRELAFAPALYLREAIVSLREHGIEGYETSLEVTHHGPTGMEFPMIFVEVGSTEREWNDLGACRVVAETIRDLACGDPKMAPSAIGFGGGHYCKKFSEITDYAMGHICPKYHLKGVDVGMVEQMISKTVPTPRVALVEKKGMGGEKRRILDILGETCLDVVMI